MKCIPLVTGSIQAISSINGELNMDAQCGNENDELEGEGAAEHNEAGADILKQLVSVVTGEHEQLLGTRKEGTVMQCQNDVTEKHAVQIQNA